MKAAIVAVPTVVTAATRMPARMAEKASGNSTSHNDLAVGHAHGGADFRTAPIHPEIPAQRISEHRKERIETPAPEIAVRLRCRRSSGMGMRNPNNARFGTVCIMDANPSTHTWPGRRGGLQQYARGGPRAVAMATAEIRTMPTCSMLNRPISSECDRPRQRARKPAPRAPRSPQEIRLALQYSSSLAQQRQCASRQQQCLAQIIVTNTVVCRGCR